MEEMVLLGAGASVEAGIPDSYGMTKKIYENISEKYPYYRYAQVISFIIGGLLFQKGIQGIYPLSDGVNVEELFNAIQILAEKDTLEISAFVGSWHTMVRELDKTSPQIHRLSRLYEIIYKNIMEEIKDAFPNYPAQLAGDEIDRETKKLIKNEIQGKGSSHGHSLIGKKIGNYFERITREWQRKLGSHSLRGRNDFAREFEEAVDEVIGKPGGGKIFEEVAELMIHNLADIVWIDRVECLEYLKPILNLLKEQKTLTVATLNYDNCIELLAESSQVFCTTGIENWSTSGTFKMSREGLFLIKLHGSIDWALQRTQYEEERPMPHSIIRQVSSKEIKKVSFRPAILFGQRVKLTAEGPFLDLLRTFQNELSKVKRLTIIGYSFRDPHINEYISQWINQNAKHLIRIINPHDLILQNEYVRKVITCCKKRSEFIQEEASKGLKRIFGNS